jgi:hypothetical protein
MNSKCKCEHCETIFSYSIIHNGFNDSAYAYCEKCGRLALLDGWKAPKGTKCRFHQSILPEAESELEVCECGGHFKNGASPRCPKCGSCLSPEKAASWIEANAPGTAKGWRWQKSWTGLYSICIENNLVKDNWKKENLVS